MKASPALWDDLRAFGLTYPGAHTKSPWPEHDDLAVKDKTFAFMSAAGVPFSLTVKLPFTREAALELPYCAPTAYGLGRSGWVSLRPGPEDELPEIEQLKSWIDESYRAVAPKGLVKTLPTFEGG